MKLLPDGMYGRMYLFGKVTTRITAVQAAAARSEVGGSIGHVRHGTGEAQADRQPRFYRRKAKNVRFIPYDS